nr:MAG TPA: hypothetical protein [Inoviridae sp.]
MSDDAQSLSVGRAFMPDKHGHIYLKYDTTHN